MNNDPITNPMVRMNRLRDQMEELEKNHCECCLDQQCQNCPIRARIASKEGELSYLFWHADYEEGD